MEAVKTLDSCKLGIFLLGTVSKVICVYLVVLDFAL